MDDTLGYDGGDFPPEYQLDGWGNLLNPPEPTAVEAAEEVVSIDGGLFVLLAAAVVVLGFK